MDPVRVGFAVKADEWLRVRPGTDGALALSIAGVMIEENLYDREFVVEWTNGPFLVREDNGQFLTGADLEAGGDANHRVAMGRGREQHPCSTIRAPVPILSDRCRGCPRRSI